MEDDETLVGRVEVVPIDHGAEARILSLIRGGIPDPATLEVGDVAWAGAPADIQSLEVAADGKLQKMVDLTGPPVKVAPSDWKPELLSAQTRHGPLLVEGGAMLPSRFSYSAEAQRIEARLQCWKWSCMGDPSGTWWAGKLQTYAGKRPIALNFIQGNALVSVDDRLVRCWRFGWPGGRQAFVLPLDDGLGLLVSSEAGNPPENQKVSDLLRAFGFAVGEPFALGSLSQVDKHGNMTGVAGIAVVDERKSRHPQNQPPAIPPTSSGADLAEFVDLVLRALDGEHRLPLTVAISHYFHGLDQAIDSKFIHNWIATETLAKRICSSPDFGAPTRDPPLVHDWAAWRVWVNSHRRDLEALANPGESDRLYNRVMGMAQRDGGKVERAFRTLGLTWHAAMTDVQDIRNFAMHEGIIAGSTAPAPRVWEQDRRRVGLMATMLTALLAKMIGYVGPIADREKSVFGLTSKEVPSWWSPNRRQIWVDHRGSGTPTVEP